MLNFASKFYSYTILKNFTTFKHNSRYIPERFPQCSSQVPQACIPRMRPCLIGRNSASARGHSCPRFACNGRSLYQQLWTGSMIIAAGTKAIKLLFARMGFKPLFISFQHAGLKVVQNRIIWLKSD